MPGSVRGATLRSSQLRYDRDSGLSARRGGLLPLIGLCAHPAAVALFSLQHLRHAVANGVKSVAVHSFIVLPGYLDQR